MRPLIVWNRWLALKLASSSAAMFVGLYLMTRIMT
jgi:hypothetical protein